MRPRHIYFLSLILAVSLIFMECKKAKKHRPPKKTKKAPLDYGSDCDEIFLAGRSLGIAGTFYKLYLDVPCLLRALLNFDIIVRFLDLVDSLVNPCMDQHPWLADCRPNVDFSKFTSNKGYNLTLQWPCLQSAITVRDFYSKLRLVYKILNPCAPKIPTMNLEHISDSDIKNDVSVGFWASALWWFWWYFISRQVVFHLTQSMSAKEDIQATIYDRGTLFGGAFNKSKPTTFLIHGFFNGKNSNMAHLFRIAYYGDDIRADKVESNVILVEWGSMSYETYLITRWRLILVSRQVAALITRMVKEFGISLSSIHIIGHSLGAHVSGITGNLLNKYAEKQKHPEKIGRITGLDPASPGFRILPDEMKINKNSAKFVDVIHTSSYTFGSADSLGHVDIFVNSGFPTQPGCGLGGFLGISIGFLDFDVVCSHSRAYFYYTEAIVSPKAFMALKCSSFVYFQLGLCEDQPIIYLGEKTNTSESGQFYLNTNSRPPFGLGIEGI